MQFALVALGQGASWSHRWLHDHSCRPDRPKGGAATKWLAASRASVMNEEGHVMNRLLRRSLLLTVTMMLLLAPSAARAQTGGTWSATGSVATAREQHTATLLHNGEVLVAGGVN